MPIEYKVGDLLEAREPYIAQGCNAQGVMGSGVAKVWRKKWPDSYEDYHNEFKTNGLFLGQVVFHHTSKFPQPVLCNCITQDFYGRDGGPYVSYDAVRSCMKELQKMAAGQAIAMPKIGAGLGGGDWNIISEIIEEEIKGPVVVYVLNESEIPDEQT